MTVIIEDASARHLDTLYEIEKQSFKEEAFSKQQIERLLTDYNSVSLLARENDKTSGFIIGAIYVGRNALNGHILTLDVIPECQRKGIGTRLLQELERIFREKGVAIVRLEVREDNVPALKLYRKFGYRRVGKLRNYYGAAHGLYLTKALAWSP